jgi:hypothetical protein
MSSSRTSRWANDCRRQRTEHASAASARLEMSDHRAHAPEQCHVERRSQAAVIGAEREQIRPHSDSVRAREREIGTIIDGAIPGQLNHRLEVQVEPTLIEEIDPVGVVSAPGLAVACAASLAGARPEEASISGISGGMSGLSRSSVRSSLAPCWMPAAGLPRLLVWGAWDAAAATAAASGAVHRQTVMMKDNCTKATIPKATASPGSPMAPRLVAMATAMAMIVSPHNKTILTRLRRLGFIAAGSVSAWATFAPCFTPMARRALKTPQVRIAMARLDSRCPAYNRTSWPPPRLINSPAASPRRGTGLFSRTPGCRSGRARGSARARRGCPRRY